MACRSVRPRWASTATLPPRTTRVAGFVLFSSIVGGTFGLGCWQLSRYFEKVKIVEQRLEEVRQAPKDVSAGPLPEASMCPLRISGVEFPAREVRVTPRTPPAGTPSRILPAATGSAGYLSVVPFQRADGVWLLCVRGWHPAAPKSGAVASPESGPAAVAAGIAATPLPAAVTGVLRLSEKPGQWAVKVWRSALIPRL